MPRAIRLRKTACTSPFNPPRRPVTIPTYPAPSITFTCLSSPLPVMPFSPLSFMPCLPLSVILSSPPLSRAPSSPRLPFMPHHLETERILQHPEPRTPKHLTSLMIEPSEGAKALFLEACNIAKETSDVDDFGSAFFEDFVEAKENYDFINENLFSDNDSNQDSDWEDIFQDLPTHQGEDASSNTNSEEPMDIDKNEPSSCKRRSLQATATIGTTAHARIKLIKILKGNLCIPRQRWSLNRLLAILVMHQKDPMLRTFYC